jgi:acetyl-CoA carboxylase carboxyl transferase subunit alpha
MRRTYLDFEQPLRELDRAVEAARAIGDSEAETRLRGEIEACARDLRGRLTPWQRVQLSRHLDRPFTLDHVAALCTDFVELHGDRAFGDDPAIVAGFGFRNARPLAVVGHQRGRGTAEKVRRNFGMPRAEGYRKARRIFRLAGRFGLNLLLLVDTQGAFPGTESEERGIAEAIAGCLAELSSLPVPIVSAIIGEGGSGGALALAVSDVLLVLENACLGVITPEGCASILSRQRSQEAIAAAAASLRLTSADLQALGVVDGVVPEPVGGAHRDWRTASEELAKAIDAAFASLGHLSAEALVARRYARLRALGREAVLGGAVG